MPGNQPQPPTMGSYTADTFPEDLGKVGYSMFFPFFEYQRDSVTSPPQMMPSSAGGTIALPLPDTINDQPVVIWDQHSFMDTIKDSALAAGGLASAAGGVAAGGLMKGDLLAASSWLYAGHQFLDLAKTVGAGGLQYYSATRGLALNPFMVMMFNRSDFKEFVFQWTLTPRTQAESDKLDKIIKKFRKYMLPKKDGGPLGQTGSNVVLKYPNVVKPQFVPDKYLFKFKYCCIRDINVDYTPGGPSFFNSQAPTAVKLQIHLTEIDLWMQDDEDLD